MYEEITLATYNTIAASYATDTIFPVFRSMIEKSAALFLELLPNHNRNNLLIVGSGDGRDGWLFKDAFRDIILYDYSTAMMDIARVRLPGARYIVNDLRDLQFPANSIDGVWASTCLYHLQKKHLPSVINRIQGALQPGGLFYLNLKTGAGELLDPHPPSYPQGGARFYAFYEKGEVMELLKQFEVLHYQDEHESLTIPYMQIIVKKH
ncbi:class I SAM-dependent DNA methyltransferase [Paraflavitalea pollutisoli]|uniref:class I SAM-dependent DNA methyltransferase n=1 Tax=Paraflavitalea pollutisoli TaxID=3034143 RepID=UPI0023EBAD44|nr:class I SAM-dependent methyltransferase [Paraflavitalea sp. H1-2-19X]